MSQQQPYNSNSDRYAWQGMASSGHRESSAGFRDGAAASVRSGGRQSFGTVAPSYGSHQDDYSSYQNNPYQNNPYWQSQPGPQDLQAVAQSHPSRAAPDSLSASINGRAQTRHRTQDTLLIWDWDDTLMCSSAINANQLMQHQVEQLDNLIEQVVRLSMRLGDTCIVTNADEQWVVESTRRFCPRNMQLLSQIPVLSARRKWELQCPGDVFAWKRETFKEVLAARQNGHPGQALNLVVLGDSPSEMEAAQTSTGTVPFHPMTIKTVKFKEVPSAEELLDQLRLLMKELPGIVQDGPSSHRDLTSSIRDQPLLRPASMPSSYNAIQASLSTAPSQGSHSASFPSATSYSGHAALSGQSSYATPSYATPSYGTSHYGAPSYPAPSSQPVTSYSSPPGTLMGSRRSVAVVGVRA